MIQVSYTYTTKARLVKSSLLLILSLSASAFAQDSKHLVCSGIVAEEIPLSIQFDEFRASDGESRTEVLSSVYQRELFQAVRLNRRDAFGENGKITLAQKNRSNRVFFKGGYNIIKGSDGSFSLKLDGAIACDPTNDSQNTTPINATLPCVDLSI